MVLISDFSKEHNYNTRSRNRLDIPKHKTAQLEKSPFYLIAKLFNHLPIRFVNMNSKNILKANLKQFLIAKEYYSLEEFFNDKFN